MPIERRRVACRFDLVSQVTCRIISDVNECHLGTLGGELRDMLCADPAGATGDEHHAVAQAGILRELIAHFLGSTWAPFPPIRPTPITPICTVEPPFLAVPP